MPVPSSIADLSTTPASNSPAGSETPSSTDDYLRTVFAFIKQTYDAAKNGSLPWGGTAGGTADALTLTPATAVTAYSAGLALRFIAAATNATTSVTVNVSGLGAKAITKTGGAALAVGDIVSGSIYEIVYDGTQFLLAAVALAGGTFTSNLATLGNFAATGNVTAGGNVTVTGNLTAASFNGGQLAGFRNLLANANFAINQRAYVSGAATTGANQYTLDRWRVVTSGQNLAFSASGNGNQITAPAGGVEQVIEAANVGGGTYTLNWTGTATATVNGAACAKGGNVSLTANTNATVRFSGGTVSKAQLEPGTVATPFEQRPISTELQICRYYFQTILVTGLNAAANLALAAGNTLYLTYSLPVTMRATPTVSSTASWTVQNVPAPTLTAFIDKILYSAVSTGAGNCFFTGLSGSLSLSSEL